MATRCKNRASPQISDASSIRSWRRNTVRGQPCHRRLFCKLQGPLVCYKSHRIELEEFVGSSQRDFFLFPPRSVGCPSPACLPPSAHSQFDTFLKKIGGTTSTPLRFGDCGKCGKFLFQSATVYFWRLTCPVCGTENLFSDDIQQVNHYLHNPSCGSLESQRQPVQGQRPQQIAAHPPFHLR